MPLILLRQPSQIVLASDRGTGLTRREAIVPGTGEHEAAQAERIMMSFNACEALSVSRLASLCRPDLSVPLQDILAVLDLLVKHSPNEVHRMLQIVRRPKP